MLDDWLTLIGAMARQLTQLGAPQLAGMPTLIGMLAHKKGINPIGSLSLQRSISEDIFSPKELRQLLVATAPACLTDTVGFATLLPE